ncbi:MAG TPA: HAD-IIIA family hydrolase [Polyangiaceae bacterium]|nr:HAD-IIIA family hydrolase [Polyangiaceae bacterium]
MTPVAIFDRDGTIIDVVRDEETGAITVAFHPGQLRLLPGAVEGMRALQDAGFALAIATNQPAPAKGQFSAAAVGRTNDALVGLLASRGVRVAALEVCMHHPEGGPGGDASLVVACECRKPGPGMLTALIARLDGDRSRSWMIGDGTADVKAGRAAGIRTALVFATNRCELCPLRTGPGAPAVGAAPDVHGATLLEIAGAILRHA